MNTCIRAVNNSIFFSRRRARVHMHAHTHTEQIQKHVMDVYMLLLSILPLRVLFNRERPPLHPTITVIK